jgi:arsenate reductase
MVKIWHNNRCSKSREAKSILEEKKIGFSVFEYLKDNFDTTDLKDIMQKLGILDIKDMLRKKETLYKELDVDNKTQEEIFDIVIKNPILVERPIIIKNNKAVIARPMENLLDLLK